MHRHIPSLLLRQPSRHSAILSHSFVPKSKFMYNHVALQLSGAIQHRVKHAMQACSVSDEVFKSSLVKSWPHRGYVKSRPHRGYAIRDRRQADVRHVDAKLLTQR